MTLTSPTPTLPEMDHTTQWDLVTRAQNGDRDAYAALYEQYVTVVFRYVLFRIGDRAVAEDLTSETFYRGLNRIDSINYQGKDVGAWFVTIARRLILDYVNSYSYRLVTPTAVIWSGDIPGAARMVTKDHAEDVTAELSRASERALLIRLVCELSEDQREVVRLRFFLGFSVTQTAEAMGRQEGAVKALQHRAVVRLRELVPTGWFQ